MPKNLSLIIFAAACIALNVTLGTLIYLLKLPLYLDSVGIMLAALLVPGTRARASVVSATVGIISFIVFGLLVSPFQPWFVATAAAGALYGSFVVRGRVDNLMNGTAPTPQFVSRLILYGAGWGIVAAVVSAPIIVYLFGGVTGAGTTLIFALLIKMGNQMVTSALLTGFSAEPIDKTLSLLLAIFLARFTPSSFRQLMIDGE